MHLVELVEEKTEHYKKRENKEKREYKHNTQMIYM